MVIRAGNSQRYEGALCDTIAHAVVAVIMLLVSGPTAPGARAGGGCVRLSHVRYFL